MLVCAHLRKSFLFFLEREVSPKLVLGQKKYGRRSRPESSELEFDPSEVDPIRAPQAEKVCTLLITLLEYL